jgi:hypothetical protein
MKRRKKKNKTRRPRRSGPRPAKKARRPGRTAKAGGARSLSSEQAFWTREGGRLKDVFKLGVVDEITFKSQRDGQMYRHKFHYTPQLLASGQVKGMLILIGHISADRSTLEIRG